MFSTRPAFGSRVLGMPIAMRSLAVAAFCLFSTIAASPAADETLTSPRGSFTIAQHYAGNWTTTLHFTKPGGSKITLGDDYPWPGLFYVSPDDQWILHIQKSGSGDNISFLYRLDSAGRLRRMAKPFGELALAYFEHAQNFAPADLYHTGIEFGAWDIRAGILRVTIRASSTQHGGERVSRKLIYDLQKHCFRTP
jgi:hypothetical protein